MHLENESGKKKKKSTDRQTMNFLNTYHSVFPTRERKKAERSIFFWYNIAQIGKRLISWLESIHRRNTAAHNILW